MMCEIPSNAILADEFLEHFDGFSIGSNDLTQLTLGLDRDSGLVAEAFDERDPAVKAMLRLAIQACRKQGKYVGICGQGPSDHPDLARWLMERGHREPVAQPGHGRRDLAGTGEAGVTQRRLSRAHACACRRCFSRFHSFSFSLARLSCCFLPFASPISSLMRPFDVVQVERHQRVAAPARPCRSGGGSPRRAAAACACGSGRA